MRQAIRQRDILFIPVDTGVSTGPLFTARVAHVSSSLGVDALILELAYLREAYWPQCSMRTSVTGASTS